jgi:pimeloyl-ACP methyl ester carboxylesterase
MGVGSVVHAAVAKPLDWFAIQLARLSVRAGKSADGQLDAAVKLLHRDDFFADFSRAPADLVLGSRGRFQFNSPVVSPWKRNNIVHGRFFPVSGRWRECPSMVLLHGWNAEVGYWTLFPSLARRLNQAGINAMLFELPYHSQRKPREREAIRNFLSGDLLHVVLAMHQAIADSRTLVAWLRSQSDAPIGVWGVSLGAWLAGMLACKEQELSLAVLMTPVVRMDRVMAELDFCRPLRRHLTAVLPHLAVLNLDSHRPRLDPENILVVASEHDLFAPIETTEELCRQWREPVLWRPRHGHISVTMSCLTPGVLAAKIVDWVGTRISRQR